MVLLYVYLLLVLVGFCFVIFRNETSLLKGDGFLKFNLIFLIIAMAVFFFRKILPEDLTAAGLIAFVALVSFLVRNKWLFFKYSPVKTPAVIEDSLSRVLMPFQKSENSYMLQPVTGEKAFLQLRNFWPSCAIIVFRGDWHLKKVEVLRNLLKKNFSGVFPRIVIKLK